MMIRCMRFCVYVCIYGLCGCELFRFVLCSLSYPFHYSTIEFFVWEGASNVLLAPANDIL